MASSVFKNIGGFFLLAFIERCASFLFFFSSDFIPRSLDVTPCCIAVFPRNFPPARNTCGTSLTIFFSSFFSFWFFFSSVSGHKIFSSATRAPSTSCVSVYELSPPLVRRRLFYSSLNLRYMIRNEPSPQLFSKPHPAPPSTVAVSNSPWVPAHGWRSSLNLPWLFHLAPKRLRYSYGSRFFSPLLV